MLWDRGHLEGRFQTRDILEAARAWVPEMREAGADVVVALSHSGIDASPAAAMMENASLQLAATPGIDAVVTGHQHRVWPSEDFAGEGIDLAKGTLNGKPATMGGFWGSHMGLIDLLLQQDGGEWKVVAAETSARPIYERNEDRSITALVGDYAPTIEATAEVHAATLEYVRAEVGTSTAPLQSYFAVVADDPSVQIVSQAQTWYVAQLLEGTEWEGLPVLSAAAPFKSGGRGGPDYYTDVPAGPIAIKNVADVYLYPTTLQAVAITGAEVKDWLERSAGIFNQVTAAGRPAADRPGLPAYNFDVIDGVTYAIDVTQPAKSTWTEPGRPGRQPHRRSEVRRPADRSGGEFVVATNNYRAGGGGAFPGADGSTVILAAPDTNRDAIVRFIVEKGTIAPSADGNWRFAPAGGATVNTGPGAQAYLEDVRARGLAIEPAGDAPDGFLRYRIAL